MNPKPKFSWAEAKHVALGLACDLTPWCELMAVVGSLRRSKEFVGDIELLYIPKIAQEPDGLFESRDVAATDARIDKMLKEGRLKKRLNVNGSETWGPKNKLAIDTASGIPVDLFATTEENWFVSLVIRTGSKDTNLRLTTGAQRQNKTLEAYGAGVRNRATGTLERAGSEEEVFKLCGVNYLEPFER